MQVLSVFIVVSTTRTLPEGAIPNSPIFHIERLFVLQSGAHYRVQVSVTSLFQATQLLCAIADEYEASQIVLESDFSTLDFS